ncbi:hypothetical protein Q5691_21510 [Microcoleus sp. w1-18aA5]
MIDPTDKFGGLYYQEIRGVADLRYETLNMTVIETSIHTALGF